MPRWPSVQSELERLEAEEVQLKQSLADLARRQVPVERVSDDARSFLESWQDIGELLDSATPEERMQILQHHIEVVELGTIDPETRTGTYAMRQFPEVRPDGGFDFGSGDYLPDDPNPTPETINGAIPAGGNGSVLVNPGRLGSHNRPESSPSEIRTGSQPVNRLQSDTSEQVPEFCLLAPGDVPALDERGTALRAAVVRQLRDSLESVSAFCDGRLTPGTEDLLIDYRECPPTSATGARL